MEFGRNKERYEFLKWGQQAFENLREAFFIEPEFVIKLTWSTYLNCLEQVYKRK